jgi:hypothetical protein
LHNSSHYLITLVIIIEKTAKALAGGDMRRLMLFAGGLMVGALVGATVVLLLTPTSGVDAREDVQKHVDGAMGVARSAAERKRIELEAELAQLTGASPKPVPR